MVDLLIASLQHIQEVMVAIWESNESFNYLSAGATDPHICQQIAERLWDCL